MRESTQMSRLIHGLEKEKWSNQWLSLILRLVVTLCIVTAPSIGRLGQVWSIVELIPLGVIYFEEALCQASPYKTKATGRSCPFDIQQTLVIEIFYSVVGSPSNYVGRAK
ncbi:hypothetical protein PROFUN_16652 [Planoprotostelium fungivorum]|uniref:Uncharacterized protein n=1 Tax=Planoprotostelium fungivorum TaxID=1890364 RepID=A0A2P6MPY9_9EUKA|nr:hypothetical protein PROFUN_16652 [Planoprotostelium fungivorum]